MPVMKVKVRVSSQKIALPHGRPICLSASLLNSGINKITSKIEKIKETKATKTDSLKNWRMSCVLNEPTVLRMPTYLALFSLRAVELFIKLMQASMSTKNPIIENNQMN